MITSELFENTETTSRILTYLHGLPYADRIYIVGSVASGKENPGDLDILVDFSDVEFISLGHQINSGEIPKNINILLQIANKYYGSFDPFLLVGDMLFTRNDEATSWARAKKAKAMLSSFNKNKISLTKYFQQQTINENRAVKKHTSYDGLDLSIEIPKGSYRTGTNREGKQWSQKMSCHYGYIKLTGAPDGDHLDCFLRTKPKKNATIWVVHQLTPDGSEYDEDKVMLGFGSKTEATRAWREHAYKPTKMMGTVSEWDPEHFRAVVHACRNSSVIMAREDAVSKLHQKGVDLGGVKMPNTVMKRLSEGMVEQSDREWLQTTGHVGVNTHNSVKLKDDDMKDENKLYGNLHEMLGRAGYTKQGKATYWKGDSVITVQKHPVKESIQWTAYKDDEQVARGSDSRTLARLLKARGSPEHKMMENAVSTVRKGFKQIAEQRKNEYTTQLIENFSSELHKYSEYEREYRRAELEAMPTWKLAQELSTLNEGAKLGAKRAELVDQIMLHEGHKTK